MGATNLFLVILGLVFFHACKTSKPKGFEEEKAGASNAISDKVVSYWIENSEVKKGVCQSTPEGQKVDGMVNRSSCEILASRDLNSFTSSLRAGVQQTLGKSQLNAEEERLLQGALLSITEDQKEVNISELQIDSSKLDELVVKYSHAIEQAINEEAQTIEIQSSSLGLATQANLVVRRNIAVTYGNVNLTPRYRLNSSYQTSGLVVRATGNSCHALPTGVAVRDRQGRNYYLTHRGAGVFMSATNQSLNVFDFQVGLTQRQTMWGNCVMEVVSLSDVSPYMNNQQPILQSIPPNLQNQFNSLGSMGNQIFSQQQGWQYLGNYFFNPGISFNNIFRLNRNFNILALQFDTRACPSSVNIFAVRTYPLSICQPRSRGNGVFMVNDCSGGFGGSGVGSMVNSLSFAGSGGWFQGGCKIGIHGFISQ